MNGLRTLAAASIRATTLNARALSTAAPKLPSFARVPGEKDGEDFVVSVFKDTMSKWRTVSEEASKLPIPYDVTDNKALLAWATSYEAILAKVGVLSKAQKMDKAISDARTEAGDSVKAFVEAEAKMRQQYGVESEFGTSDALQAALAKAEAKIGKPLLFSDKAGMKGFSADLAAFAKTHNLGDPKLVAEAEAADKVTFTKDLVESAIADAKKGFFSCYPRNMLSTEKPVTESTAYWFKLMEPQVYGSKTTEEIAADVKKNVHANNEAVFNKLVAEKKLFAPTQMEDLPKKYQASFAALKKIL